MIELPTPLYNLKRACYANCTDLCSFRPPPPPTVDAMEGMESVINCSSFNYFMDHCHTPDWYIYINHSTGVNPGRTLDGVTAQSYWWISLIVLALVIGVIVVVVWLKKKNRLSMVVICSSKSAPSSPEKSVHYNKNGTLSVENNHDRGDNANNNANFSSLSRRGTITSDDTITTVSSSPFVPITTSDPITPKTNGVVESNGDTTNHLTKEHYYLNRASQRLNDTSFTNPRGNIPDEPKTVELTSVVTRKPHRLPPLHT